MQTVNEYMVRDILCPLGGSADSDDKIYQYQDVNSNDKALVKKIISEVIKPYYEKQTEEYKASAKRSLSYFLTTDRIDYGYIFDSCLIAFDHPTDARDFFVWIWEILFPTETFILADTEKYSEINDINEGNSYS